ncbi:type III toxin-antitoxin system ToxN/AbiQ family toxin [Liquorilactobacillus hordei]|uniref:type III toxin-antitoxin system ToxN/AbiQ family toxin n=1 Tax=Liquorilactobacillus hordei TaxID=468911 RepID=UPI0039EB84BD
MIKLLAVLNINNMIPAPFTLCKEIDIDNIADINYRNLLTQEYFICKRRKQPIKKSSHVGYFIFVWGSDY